MASVDTTSNSAGVEETLEAPATKFQPVDCKAGKPAIQLPDELWLTILESPCTFPSNAFSDVMLNLTKNPNITSSYLFRADIYYDSDRDYSMTRSNDGRIHSALSKSLKADYQPLPFSIEGHEITRTMVRKLVPRNPQLDDALLQTCHFLSRTDALEETSMVVYIPHVQDVDHIPFYHPSVSRLAFIHTPKSASSTQRTGSSSISISYCLFPGMTLTIKLERTALRLLQTIHKHGQGQLTGYEKRVHLDQVIPQKRYQDTYARLKAKYGKHLAEGWVEVTDASKHVFEDISIAAFLIELWRDMYAAPSVVSVHGLATDGELYVEDRPRPEFPGFVDIGCGNGVLVYLLLSEGYDGWGFDARERKTWQTFPQDVRKKLQHRLLVPEVFPEAAKLAQDQSTWHNGVFVAGTFIISNHADELTAWTPLLAYQNGSAFVAIPCCSHDFTGARFRAPASVKSGSNGPARLAQQCESQSDDGVDIPSASGKPHAAETGSLRRSVVQKKMLSAYSTLCSYVTSLAEEVGYEPEREVLRIPSTRNQCIIGRHSNKSRGLRSETDGDASRSEIVDIVERELKTSIDAAATAWIGKAEKLSMKPGSGH